MSQKSNKNKPLIKQNDLKKKETKIFELNYIHLNFAFCITKQNCKIEYYKKLHFQLQKVSKMSQKEFMQLGKSKTGHIKLETNPEIIKRQEKLNQNYIEFRKNNNIKNKFSTTYDFLRDDLYRAYGELHENILYVLELDPKGISRKH